MTYYIGNNLFDEFETCTLQECVDYLSGQEVIGLDIETGRKFPKGTYREDVYKPGLDPRVSRILMVQVGTLEKRFVIDARVVDVSPLLPMLESESVIKVGANLAFESLHFRHNFGINIRNLYDVLLVDRVLTNGLYTSYSLEALLKRYRNYESRTTMDLFGQRSMESEVKKLFEARVDDYIFSHGFITEEVEEELLIEVTEEIEDRYVDKSIRLEFVEWGDKPFRKEHIWYGEKDITEPLLLRDIFLKGRVIEYDGTREVYNPLNAIKMENRLIEPLSEMMHQGVCLDPLQWKEIAQEKKRLYYEKIEWLNNWVVDNHPEFGGAIDMFTNKATCMVKWSSPKQVQKLFHKLGLTVRARSKFTGKVEDTVGAKELLKALPNEYKAKFFESKFPDDIVEGKDLVLAYLLVKKLQQLHTTYGEQFLNYLHPITGRIHCNIRQYLHTSRMAAVRPNMLAVPRGKEYRSCFIAPKGMKVWACDYSSQEIFTNAEVFDNETLQGFFIEKLTNPKVDMHSWMATKMYSIIYNDPDWKCIKGVHNTERQNAKIGGFSIVYGASGKAIADMLGVSIEEGEDFIINYFKSLPGLKEKYDEAKKLALKRGWVEIDSLTHKRYFFKDFDKMNSLREKAIAFYPDGYRFLSDEEKAQFKSWLYEEHPEVKACWKEWGMLKGKLERRSINFRVQGSAATQTKAAILYMWRQWNKDCFPVLIIHDKFVVSKFR